MTSTVRKHYIRSGLKRTLDKISKDAPEKWFDWEVTLGMVDHNGKIKTKTVRVPARNKEEAIEQAERRWASYDPGTGSVGGVRKIA